MQLAHALHCDIPGAWSSNIVATFRRAEETGALPAGTTAVAETVHRYHVGAQVRLEETPPTAEVLQIVVLAYRLAWETHDVIDAAEPATSAPTPQ